MRAYLTIDFVVPTNATWGDVVTFYEPWAGMETGVPVPEDQPPLDFTGCDFKMHMRKVAGQLPRYGHVP
jgi:hypothetical protein